MVQLKSNPNGYEVYKIKKGDTIYKISNMFNTSIHNILVANPRLDPYNLSIGKEIIVPLNEDIVKTDINYTYDVMEQNIKSLKTIYPFIKVDVIGKSVLGRNLYCIKLGSGKNEVFYNATHHSLEWITSVLLMKFVENFAKAYAGGKSIRGYNVGDIWRNNTIYIVPMVNPDGVELVLNGLKKTNPYYNDLIKWNDGSTDFSNDWQANNRGVDLNHNYNAGWQKSRVLEKTYGIYGPGPTRYSGPYPESEPETQAMVEFTKKHNFKLVIAYHSQGQVIYWRYDDVNVKDARRIAQAFATASGYTISETSGIASYAGYKDWFIQDFEKPGFTIEVGIGKNPLPISQFNTIYKNNEEILLLAPII